jgi:hypothetical protein
MSKSEVRVAVASAIVSILIGLYGLVAIIYELMKV